MAKCLDVELPYPYDAPLNEALKSLDEADTAREAAKRHLRICMAALVIAGVKPRDVATHVSKQRPCLKRSDVDHALEVVQASADEMKEANDLARRLTWIRQ
jgi:hypothetical protein